ncbi:MAG: hypothetical protein J6X22_01955 [Muribaculaceae bacterium]|nr:hypothetical protein [Muribaculaceae bacterium]
MTKIRHILLAFVLLTGVMAVAQPVGINAWANHIVLNGDNWDDLIAYLNNQHRHNYKFTIVHIGDSHVQPGIISDEVRKTLQERYGNGGRGLISPLALAGTNEPSDYLLKSSSSISASSRLLSSSKPAGMGMTGVAVKFSGASTTLSIKAKRQGDDFYRITIFHSPSTPFTVEQNGTIVKGRQRSNYATDYVLDSSADTANLRLTGSGALYGVRLLNSNRGVVVDCIGNNGATYRSYLNIDNFARQISDLEPQLVIISLGTNEAYGSFGSITSNIDQMLSDIRRQCPRVKFLLTTPMETQKRSSRGYHIQSNVAEVRDLILAYGKNHQVPVWDFYQVAGGAGASNRWLRAHYMKTDHLHLGNDGYHLQGSLLAEALLRLLTGEDDGSDIVAPIKQTIEPEDPATEGEETNEGEVEMTEDGQMIKND